MCGEEESATARVAQYELTTLASQNEATIFTGHIWVKTGESRGFVIVSDALNHTKQSISSSTYIGELSYYCAFSDGAAQQFNYF